MFKRNENKTARPGTKYETLRLRAADVLDVLKDAISNYGLNGDTNQAAAIALYAILSAIPLFILTIVVAGYAFSSYPQIHADITEAVSKGFFSEKILVQLGEIEKKSHLLGWVGVLGLIWLSSTIFDSISTALNIIFRSQKKRNFFLAKLLAIAMIPMAWIIGVASIGISYVTTLVVKHPAMLADSLGFPLSALSATLLRYIVPYLITAIFISVLYCVIPTTKVRLRVAVVGASIFALLAEVAKQLFTWYAANYTRYNIIFGSMEAIVILVIGVFYIALIFLFCAELMSSYQRRDVILLEGAILKSRKNVTRVDERLFKKFGRSYEKDSTIFHEGDSGHEMFYVLSGQVNLEKVDCQVKKVLAEIRPGQYFGEMAALIDISRSATARAVEDCHLAVIDDHTFREMLRESREVGLHMLREFSRRLKNSNKALEELTNLWIRMVLVIHFIDNPAASIEEHMLRLIALTRKEPAQIMDILAELAREGILSIQSGVIQEVATTRMWTLLDSGEMKKCFIEEKDKA